MILYILIISLVNLCLGYALAIWLSRGFPGTWFTKPIPTDSASSKSIDSAADKPAAAPSEVVPAADNQSALLLESAIDGLQRQLNQYRDRLSCLDERVRQCAAEPDGSEFDDCIDDLNDLNQRYLDHQGTVVANWRRHSAEAAALAPLDKKLEQAITAQNAQIKSSTATVNALRGGPDLQLGCRRLLDETNALVTESFKTRDASDRVLHELAKGHGRSQAGRRPAADLPGFFLPSQVELEMQQWRHQCRDDRHALSVAMIDIDGLQTINRVYGPQVGNKVVDAVGKVLSGSLRGTDLAARMDGSKYLVAMPETSAPTASAILEQARQTIEQTQFRRGETQIQVTISCGLAEADRDDEIDSLVARCETALHDAKRSGRNQTFFHDGKTSVAAEMAVG